MHLCFKLSHMVENLLKFGLEFGPLLCSTARSDDTNMVICAGHFKILFPQQQFFSNFGREQKSALCIAFLTTERHRVKLVQKHIQHLIQKSQLLKAIPHLCPRGRGIKCRI